MIFSYHLTGRPLEYFIEAVTKLFKKVFMANDLFHENLKVASSEMACKSVLRAHYHHNNLSRLRSVPLSVIYFIMS